MSIAQEAAIKPSLQLKPYTIIANTFINFQAENAKWNILQDPIRNVRSLEKKTGEKRADAGSDES